jgi:sugar phosphate isomerase/epimerase
VRRAFSLAALTVLELSPPEMVAVAAEAGFSHVGLRLVPATPDEPQYPFIGDTPLVRETLARLAATGVKCLDVEIVRLKPDTNVADYVPMLETGARLGATEVLVAGNDPDERRLTDRFGALCDAAAKLGLHPSLEPMPWTDVRDITQAARILAAAGRPNCGVLIDAIHFDRAGSRTDDIARVPRQWFRYVQLCDAPAERPSDTAELLHQARAERLFPGQGGLDLAGLVQALPRDIPISLEIPTARLAASVPAAERARRMLAATRALLARVDDARAAASHSSR